jgi:hypothetical protein
MVSLTAKIIGRGSDRYKRVIGLTAEERAHVREGGTVLVPDPMFPARGTTQFKKVVWTKCWGYQHRNYTEVK